MKNLHIIVGDITKLHVDAIVNAANTTLLGGGGVDGAIHRAAGPGLLKECKVLNGCETGQAKVTGAYNLPCKYIIHAVGPIYNQYHDHNAIDLLTITYLNSCDKAKELGIKTIAFPCISTGVYGFPKRSAAIVALTVLSETVFDNTSLTDFIICCFSQQDKDIYLDIFKQYAEFYSGLELINETINDWTL